MNKKVKVSLILTGAAAVIAGIAAGITIKLHAGSNFDYKERIAANKDIEIKGEKLYHVNSDSPEYQEETYYRKSVYKDDGGLCYTFDADTQELRFIENIDLSEKDYTGVMAEDLKPYSNPEKLLADAKLLIEKGRSR